METSAPATPDDVRRLATATFTQAAQSPGPGSIGLESEHFLIRTGAGGSPGRRVTMAELTALLDGHPQLSPEPPDPDRLTGWHAPDGARFMPEPGAQLEYAGAPHCTGEAALGAMSTAITDIATLADFHGMAVISAGLDPWHPADAIPQQLTSPRYPAMSSYLRSRTSHGHAMMTNSASLQVNLDLGQGDQPAARWTAALLTAPLATAAFACSPVPGAVNGRASLWRWLDPTRTGIPQAFLDGRAAPVDVLVETALDADVLLFNRDGAVHPGRAGFSLRTWLADGHPDHGVPTVADIGYHLTTLFPEVRARGFLEVRSVDSLPGRWRMVPPVLLAGMLYDPQALDTVTAILQPYRTRLPELLDRAIHVGLADGELCALAVGVWTTAAEGAHRLGRDYFDPADVRRAEVFLDHFTLRGRSPSDELREHLAHSPRRAFDWAREPAGSLSLC